MHFSSFVPWSVFKIPHVVQTCPCWDDVSGSIVLVHFESNVLIWSALFRRGVNGI